MVSTDIFIVLGINIIRRNHDMFLHTLTEDYNMKYISDQMIKIMERLAEMFPKQHYQSELDSYISARRPLNAADVEHYTKEFEYKTLSRSI